MCDRRLELENRVKSAAEQLSKALDAQGVAAHHRMANLSETVIAANTAEQEWLTAKAEFSRHLREHGC